MNREAKIGLFVLIALSVMAYFVLRTSDVKALLGSGDPKRQVKLSVPDATGIREGTSVEIAGVKIGKVLRVGLEDGKAVAVLSVPADLQLYENARGELKTKGVLGERYIALDVGDGVPAPDQTRLAGDVPASLDDITTTIKRLGDNLVEITDNLKESMKTPAGDNRIAEISANIEQLTAALVAMTRENRGNVLRTSDQMANLAEALNRDIPSLVSELSGLVGQLRSTAGENRPQIDAALANMASATKNLEKTTETISSITGKVDMGRGTIGRLINDASTIDKFNTVLDTANESLDQVKDLVDRATELEMDFVVNSDYIVDAEASKTYFGVVFRPNANKYYLIQAVSISDELIPEEFTLAVEEVFDADGNLISTSIQQTTQDPDDVEFNAQLAYRFGPAFLRTGLFESELGAALDYVHTRSGLDFSMSAWDFGSRDNPYAQFAIRYNIGKHIRLSVGMDNFLADDRESALIGAGIAWNDEDLKVIFGSAGRLFR
ncbi:MAG: MlaD family protein [Acidobacteriota bacterium]|nr:MlaD family protein [Acidobacteriota bacterium]